MPIENIQADRHTQEVQDILDRPPFWLVLNGTLIVIGFLGALIVGAWLWEYPDIISVPVTLTVHSNASGKIYSVACSLQPGEINEIRPGQPAEFSGPCP